MGVPRRWISISYLSLARIPDEPGAHEIGDRRGRVIDIGNSWNIAERIPRKIRDSKFRGQAAFFRYVEDDDPDVAERYFAHRPLIFS